ncbi:hypothetical protein Pmani_035163 [Petrolisthes manimaculis]|uniref:Uncharacterized protein n=1 Tax=Petrolisthes manimaculis TaxID=1843537 RepID=A0AAE1NMW3_9EUCA|nr:hypothetical protein Pmani_035163 [Petrolisthes manimaculis]
MQEQEEGQQQQGQGGWVSEDRLCEAIYSLCPRQSLLPWHIGVSVAQVGCCCLTLEVHGGQVTGSRLPL